MLCGLAEYAGLAFVLESEALAVDADDDRVVQDTIEHRRRRPLGPQIARTVLRDTSSVRAISRMLLPCLLKTRISTASSATSMRPSTAEYPTPGWVSFQSATRISFASATTTEAAASAVGLDECHGPATSKPQFGLPSTERDLALASRPSMAALSAPAGCS